MFIRKNKKAFTLVELIVVIAIIGILVLLATPRFVEQTKEAKMAHIKNDIKVVENVLDYYLFKENKLPNTMPKANYSALLLGNKIYGKTGIINELEGDFYDISLLKEVKDVNSKLNGKFIGNNDGEVYYVHDVDYVSSPIFTSLNTHVILNDKVYVAGYGTFNIEGVGIVNSPNTLMPLAGLQNKGIVEIRNFGFHNFGIDINGNVYVWGNNSSGQLGLGNNSAQSLPVKNTTLSQFKSKEIKGGYWHSLIIENNKVYSWGDNGYGQLGLGNKTNRNTPTEVVFFSNNNIKIKDVFAGHYHSFATTTDNKLYAWGRNDFGQLGIGNTTSMTTPTEVVFFRGKQIKDIQNNETSTFVLLETGELYAFGDNSLSQLNIGNEDEYLTPQLTRISSNGILIDKIHAGSYSIIVEAVDGKIYGWGYNDYGELGLGYTGIVNTHTRLENIENLSPIKIQLSYYHTNIIAGNNEIYACGDNYGGQLGLGIGDWSINTPTKININPLLK